MMKIFLKLGLLFFCLVGVAQDIQFSQFYAVPLYQNPAFAGSAHAPRVMLHNRLQWPGINSSATTNALSRYTTALVAADHFWSKYRSGAGVMILRDWQAGNLLSSTEASVLYAYEIPLAPNFTLRPGLQASYVMRTIDYSRLRFPEDFDDQNGFNGNVRSGGATSNYADFSSGIVGYSSKLWAGISFHHLNQPNQSFIGATDVRLPIKMAITGGYKIYLKHPRNNSYLDDEKEVSLTPTMHYKSQGKNDQTDLGVYLNYDQLMAGLWYRGIPFKKYSRSIQNNEAMIMLVGWKYNNWAVTYSYDLTVSKLATVRTGGAHELNLTYVHHQSKKYKPMKRLPCPSFYKH
jgi:type IX secretion system PorP/SprF family membrane protein